MPNDTTISTAATIGYARTSTMEQLAGLDAQARDLTAAGCQHIYSEQVSSVALERPPRWPTCAAATCWW